MHVNCFTCSMKAISFKMRPTLVIITFILTLIASLGHADDSVAPKTIYLPDSMRAEGRITLTYSAGNQTVAHHLAFTELVDRKRIRSKISIGYLSNPLKEYHTQWGKKLMLDNQGRCREMKEDSFVPELDWFARMIYTDDEVRDFVRLVPEQIGPSGLLWIVMLNNKNLKSKYGGKVKHRNLDCHIASITFDRSKCKQVQWEMYVPEKSFFTEKKVPFFAIKETTSSDQIVGPQGETKYATTVTVDYFNIEPIDSLSDYQKELLEYEHNLPLARGCSEFLPKTHPYGWSLEHSFMMHYYQRLANTQVSVAYDDKSSLLRREFHERSVSIWDLKEELMYHIDLRGVSKIHAKESGAIAEVAPCSVLSVADDRLGPSMRPYAQPKPDNNKPLILIDLLGIHVMSFLGRGRVRNMPCTIYETIMEEPPILFALNAETKARNGGLSDYIVQFYLLRSNAIATDWGVTKSLDENFWPARIVLYKRDKKSGQVTELDQLEVFDFHWGLMGWDTKASDLFMAPECFEQEDEQVRVELAIHLDRYNLNADRRLIAHNKFKLEKDLLDDTSALLHLSRLHITEFELSLRPHDILLSMVVGDRKQEKKIVYSGEGALTDEASSLTNRVTMPNLGEQTCVYLASLVTDISLVVHCPSQGPEVQSTCTAVFGQRSSSVRTADKQVAGADSKANTKTCQVYTFSEEAPPISALVRWKLWGDQLASHRLQFVAKKHDGADMTINGSIQDFDVSRPPKLMSINHYKFSIDDVEGQNIRHFDTMQYNNVGDCAKVCSLDVDCRSYSYCGEGAVTGEMTNKLSAEEICVLSSLDIRGSQFEEKLTRTKTRPDNKVVVSDKPGSSYTLELASRCSIHERDYLDMYSLTDEVVSVGFEMASQFRSEKSAVECAKWSVDVEQQHPEHHVAMFAYCPRSNTCLMDEDLFAQLKGNQSSGMITNDDVIESNAALPAELQCQVYRRKYQTYFHLSAEVVERNPMYQLDLNITAVEECARACWMRFGQICHSFDFCSPQHCTINIIPMEAFEDVIEQMTKKREYRTGCLHYERDLRLDKLRQEHLIGKHQVLDVQRLQVSKAGPPTWSRWFLNVFLFCLLVASFSVGLTVGHRVNDNLENVTILALRQSFSAGPANLARRASQALGSQFNFSRFTGESPLISGSDEFGGSGNGASNGYHEHNSSAIQMDELKRKDAIIEEEEEEEDDAHQNPGDISKQQSDVAASDSSPAIQDNN